MLAATARAAYVICLLKKDGVINLVCVFIVKDIWRDPVTGG